MSPKIAKKRNKINARNWKDKSYFYTKDILGNGHLLTLAVDMYLTPWMVDDSKNSFSTSIFNTGSKWTSHYDKRTNLQHEYFSPFWDGNEMNNRRRLSSAILHMNRLCWADRICPIPRYDWSVYFWLHSLQRLMVINIMFGYSTAAVHFRGKKLYSFFL